MIEATLKLSIHPERHHGDETPEEIAYRAAYDLCTLGMEGDAYPKVSAVDGRRENGADVVVRVNSPADVVDVFETFRQSFGITCLWLDMVAKDGEYSATPDYHGCILRWPVFERIEDGRRLFAGMLADNVNPVSVEEGEEEAWADYKAYSATLSPADDRALTNGPWPTAEENVANVSHRGRGVARHRLDG